MKNFFKLIGIIAITAVIGFSTVSCGDDNAPVAVTGVTLSPTTLSLKEGNSQALTAAVTPSNATNKEVTWTTSDEKIATVVNGTVNAVAEGTATITVTTTEGNFTAACKVTVSPIPPEEKPDQERWRSSFEPSSTVTITHSVADDGVCTITVGGTALELDVDGDDWWNMLWKATAGYPYTVEKDKKYSYKFEAWTDGDDRYIVVEWYWSYNPEDDSYNNQNIGYGDYGRNLDYKITSERKTYKLESNKIPESGVQPLNFYCANQTGTFYVKILEIKAVD